MRTDTRRFRRTVVSRAAIAALAGTAAMLASQATLAQQTSLERVEITGSAIRRVDAESTVPVTVLKADELRQQGYTTVEEIVNTLSANQSVVGTSQSVGAGYLGASFANMRGLGANKTLVLLNGRRIVNNAIDSSAPDLNMIPIAAVERVEVLRDGASSLYGTDAIGGVINFITKKDWQGGTASATYESPQHPGGKSYSANVGYGVGNLDTSKWNVFGFLDYQHQDRLQASQRAISSNKDSAVPYPGVYFSDASNYIVSPYSATGCNGAPFNKVDPPYGCRYYYWNWVDDIPPTDRMSGMLKATVRLAGDHQLGLEYFATQSRVDTAIAPVPFGGLTVNPGTKYFPGNGITPAPPADAGFDLTQPITVLWRDIPNGPRADRSDNTLQRFVASLQGTIGNWDYDTALTWSHTKNKNSITGGYTDGDIIRAGMENGTINPFGAQDAAGQAMLDSATVTGTLTQAVGTVVGWDGKVSSELGDWFHSGRKAALALGLEARHEKMEQSTPDVPFATAVMDSTGYDPATHNVGSRSVWAAYAELNMPVTKQFEVTAAARYDKYSDFGSTFNPKVSFRFQPNQTWLMRGSATTGFRAPSLYDMHQASVYTNTAGSWNDPVLCPDGTAVPGAVRAKVCDTQFTNFLGGNLNLKPEKSQGVNLGFVLQPVAQFDASVDFWWVHLQHQIGSLGEDLVFGDPTTYASVFHRAPDGHLTSVATGNECPGTNCGFLDLRTQNLGDVITNGVDFNAAYRWRLSNAGQLTFRLNTTYVNRYVYQQVEGGPWYNNVAVYSNGGPVFRWQNNAALTWSMKPWTVGIVNHYKSGYLDEDGASQVGAWSTWDLFGSWQFTKNATFTVGVRNVMDKLPPRSNQIDTFQVGYDPRFSDPLQRVFYVRGQFDF